MSLIYRALKSALFEDLIFKFICLALAVLMWLYIDGELTDQRTFAVQMRPADIQLKSGWSVAPNSSLPEFLVSVRGPRRRLQLSSTESAGFHFKKHWIENAHAGRNVLNIDTSDISAEGFEILSVSPKDEREATVELVATTNQLKNVLVKTSRCKQGYLIEKAEAEPTQVTVEGRSEDLEKIKNVWTDEIDVTQAEKDVIRDVPIQQTLIVDGQTLIIRCVDKVRASVTIHHEAATRRMSFDVRTCALPGTAMTVEPRTVEVEVTAEAQEFTDLAGRMMIYVDWPSAWERPQSVNSALGPLPMQVRVLAPGRVQVRGVNGADLPTVQVHGALAGALNGNKEGALNK